MKRLFYLAAIALISSCAGGNGYTITGVVEGVEVGDTVELFNYSEAMPEEALAMAVVSNVGEFTLSGTVETPGVGVLMVNGYMTIGAVVVEAGEISVVLDQGAIKIGGTPLNDANAEIESNVLAFRRKFYELDSSLSPDELIKLQDAIYEEYTAYVTSVVDENLDNPLGAFVFATQEYSLLETPQSLERMAQFSDGVKQLDFMQELASEIEVKLRTEVGQKYTDIELLGADGQAIALSELLAQGKYVLVDFWATWCGPCMAEMPHLKEAYAEYKDRGFEIYGVSLDRSAEDWKAAISADYPWTHVINSAESTATTDYAVRTIPSNFLISPEGIIVAKDLRGSAVATTLSEHIK